MRARFRGDGVKERPEVNQRKKRRRRGEGTQ